MKRSDCACGCGLATASTFAPGHDQRLRSRLERRVGGLLALEELVSAMEAAASDRMSAETLSQTVRRILSSANRLDRVAPRETE